MASFLHPESLRKAIAVEGRQEKRLVGKSGKSMKIHGNLEKYWPVFKTFWKFHHIMSNMMKQIVKT
jgi:hypothetical protein